MFLCWSLAQIGDQVIRINGLPVEEALHKEMLNMIRSKTQVTLKVRSKSFFVCLFDAKNNRRRLFYFSRRTAAVLRVSDVTHVSGGLSQVTSRVVFTGAVTKICRGNL